MNEKSLIRKIIGEQVKSIRPIHQGVSNTSYLVNKQYVVRIKSEKERFYKFKEEKEVLHKTSNLFLSEFVTYLDKDGNKVSEYINNAHSFKGDNNEIIAVAKMLKKLHDSKIEVKAKFKPLKRYYYYKNKSNGEEFQHEGTIIINVKKLYNKYPLIICHNDLVDNNLLFTKTGSYLIDYEYAGRNIYLFDLASFLSENEIRDKRKVKLFLTTYGFPMSNIDELQTMIMFLNLLWYYWALERYNATKRKIFLNISNMKKRAIIEDIKALSHR
ncbi:MAG: phosphotransferase [Bacilli bacterium]|nr:phosphotransferase [Bacilli bacterium]